MILISNAYYVLTTFIISFNPTTTSYKRVYYCYHFTGKEIKAHDDKTS